jgi:glycerophosphoryl diester phosphodiesterase
MGLDLFRKPGDLPKLVGHRGACDVAPENTMPSFERALVDGADIVEMDLRLSLDGHVVVVHDARVDRTSDGVGYVSELALAELKELDAGSWFAPHYSGTRIPTADEVFDWARGKIGMLLELKFQLYGGYDPALVPAVIAAIQRAKVEDQVAIISYQPRALVQVKALLPHIPVGPLPPRDPLLYVTHRLSTRHPGLERIRILQPALRRVLLAPLRFTLGWGCDVVAPNIDVVTRTLVRAAHAAGCPVSSGGLLWDYPAAIEMGVDTVSANDPGLVRTRYLLPQRPSALDQD